MIPVPPDEPEGWEPLPLPAVLEGVDPQVLEAFLAFHKVVNTFEQLMIKDLSEEGTQPSQITCLRLLAERDGISQREIADALRISRARVTAVVRALEKQGAVRRERDGNDGRITRVYLTELGREIDRRKGRVRDERINQIFADMTPADRDELRRRLDDLTARIERVLKSG